MAARRVEVRRKIADQGLGGADRRGSLFAEFAWPAHGNKANDFLAMAGQDHVFSAFRATHEIGQMSFGFRYGDVGHGQNMDQSVVQIKIQPPTICIPSHSAIRAGLSAPSLSTVTSCVSSQRPPPLSSADSSLNRPRTFDPAGTGARKRSLSKP